MSRFTAVCLHFLVNDLARSSVYKRLPKPGGDFKTVMLLYVRTSLHVRSFAGTFTFRSVPVARTVSETMASDTFLFITPNVELTLLIYPCSLSICTDGLAVPIVERMLFKEALTIRLCTAEELISDFISVIDVFIFFYILHYDETLDCSLNSISMVISTASIMILFN